MDHKERVLKTIQANSGSPLSKIAKLSEISMATVSKYCHILEAEKRITIEKFGDMKIVRAKGK